ncbi:hypothetical protein JJB79_09140 [Pantoea eucrina]|uniref:E3 ubiquitin-protein ligase SopA n=1 Tax=Pantoea eucrina TaxID=472693 RepID=A0ABS1Z589_9GAMM|nr:hypothetical protein [Pantoea eucrina]MBM0747580.1 hypothetical protein [Pantoea eucrina]
MGKIKSALNSRHMFRKEHTERTLQKKSYLLTYLYGENIFGAPLGRCSIDRREVDNEGTVRGSLRYKLTDVISMDAPLPLHMVDEAVNLFNAGGTPDFRRNSYEELCSFRITLDQRARLLREHKKLPATDSLLTEDKHINFRKLKLDNIYIPKDMFEKADFSYSSLGKRDITGHNLSWAIFKNSSMQLDFSRLSDEERDIDLFFNHHNNPEGTPLTALQSIDNRFADFKKQLAREIINELSRQDITLQQLISTAIPILEVFGKEPFCSDPSIRQWHDRLTEEWFYSNRHISGSNLNLLSHATIENFLRLITHDSSLLSQKNALFHQIIDLTVSENHENSSIAARAQESYDRYLQSREVTPYTRFEHFSRTSALSEPTQVNLQGSDAVNLVLMPANPGGPVLLMSLDTMRGMLRPDPLNPVWNHFYQMDTPQNCLKMVEMNPENLFRRNFPQFLTPFLAEQQKNTLSKLLDLLKLGKFRKAFDNATEAKSSTEKMIDKATEFKLEAHFRPMLYPDEYWSQLTQQHARAVTEAYGIADASPRNKAEYFLCISAVFTRLSSSFYFGTETESPLPLRAYAHALMLQAAKFDPTIFDSPSLLIKWQNQFQGSNGLLECTAALSQGMFDYLNRVCPQTLAAVRPLAWS